MAFGYLSLLTSNISHAFASQSFEEIFKKPKLPVGATDPDVHAIASQSFDEVSEKPKLPVGATDSDVHAFASQWFDYYFFTKTQKRLSQ